MQFSWLSFDELTKKQLYQICVLRQNVFTGEQKIVEADLDGVDVDCYFLFCGDPVVGTCRVIPPGDERSQVSIGRLAVSGQSRGQGLGRRLMEQAIKQSQIYWPDRVIKLSAQSYLKDFYLSLGFGIAGESYMEAGIPHIPMYMNPDS